MKLKAFHICIGVALSSVLEGVVCAQAPSTGRVVADTNNAVIEGRVTLPSGFSADRNVKITLKNSQSILYTLYSNKHGEFRFHDLSEGTYFVQAEVDRFESAIEKIPLGRGITWEVTLQLIETRGHVNGPGGRVVSLAELRQSVPAPAKREYRLGVKFVGKSDIPQAAMHFKQALALFPDYLAARNDLGAQYLKLKQLDAAEGEFRIVIERDPKNFYATFNLGLVRIERRDYGGAIAQLQQAISIDSAWPTTRLWIGIAQLEIGDVAAAERELLKALVMGGSDCTAAHYHLARIYFMRGDISEASRAIRAYLEESPRGEYVKEARELAKKLGNHPRLSSK